MKKHIICALLTAGLASGCVAMQRSGTAASFDGLSAAHAADARALAEVAAEQLAERHAPAHTALALDRANGAFGESLEKALRLKGFAIVPQGYGGSSLGVSYRLGALEGSGPAVGFAQVTTTDGKVFAVSRLLDDAGQATAPTYTEPPAKTSPPRELESRPLPENPAPPVSRPTADPAPAKVKRYPVRETATASVIARRSGVDVDDFCRWNGVGKRATLPKGTLVYLSEPPAGTIVAGPDVPVPSGVTREQDRKKPGETSVATAFPTKAQTSYALTPPAPAAHVAPVTPAAPVAPVTSVTPVAAPVPPEVDMPPVSSPSFPWEIQKGMALRSQMEGWATVAGYHLIWESPNDYMMESQAVFHGTYLDAVKKFFAALAANGHALRVTVYEGNRTVVVSDH